MNTTTNESSTDAWSITNSENKTLGYKGSDRIPSFIFCILASIIGSIGNSHALYIYMPKYRKQMRLPTGVKNPYLVFVLSLAIIDIISCLLVMPFEITVLSTNFTPFPLEICKILRYLQFFVHMSSALHVLLISIHCWRQACYPHTTQINGRIARNFCIVNNVVAIIFAIPSAILAGFKTETIDGVRGQICYVSEKYFGTCYSSIYMSVLATLFLVLVGIICASYIALILSLWKGKTKDSNLRPKKGSERVKRTTITLVILTVVFVASYIPFLVMALMAGSNAEFSSNWSHVAVAVGKLFLRIPHLNNIVNPIVYGLRDKEFQQKLRQMYSCLMKGQKEDIENAS